MATKEKKPASKDPKVINDVYSRFLISARDLPQTPTPSAHSNEMELFCLKQSAAAYSVYPNSPLEEEAIPTENSSLYRERALATEGFFGGAGETSEGESGWGRVVGDRVSALVVWRDKRVVVAFRGTANWQDWAHNFASRTELKSFDGAGAVEVHSGFFGLADNILPATLQFIAKRVGGDGVELILSGHSLGGAIAMAAGMILAAEWDHRRYRPDYYRHRFPILAIYTYGAPQLGKRGITNHIPRPHYRLVVRGDPVPSVPPRFVPDYEATYLAPIAERNPGLVAGAWHLAKAPFRALGKATGLLVPAHFTDSYERAIRTKIELIETMKAEMANAARQSAQGSP